MLGLLLGFLMTSILSKYSCSHMNHGFSSELVLTGGRKGVGMVFTLTTLLT